MSRPEYQAPPEYYYNADEAKKYTQNTRVIDIQCVMADRCVQLLDLDDNASLILDIGCGSGLSGDVLDEYGYAWVGMDISKDMLDIAIDREVDGDMYLNDIG
mmetsp:Transcript_18568/g.16174  ORF Transcript_18568/g.16174 Transcript_18568/m.16174 type:complete len:102 (-) Transcript_18568:341-646(-)